MKSVITSISLFFIALTANAGTIHVPSEQPTIQAGINAAQDGDVVIVSEGKYDDNIVFNGRKIVLASEFILDEDFSHVENTIIAGDHSSSVVTFNNSETFETMIIGFTIKNGSFKYGGGIYCDNASPTIRNNIIIENEAQYGGGIALRGANSPYNPQVDSNIIAKNIAYDAGGGIYYEAFVLKNNEGLVIGNNTIYGNSSYNSTNMISGESGGIFISGTGEPRSQPRLFNNIFWANRRGQIKIGDNSHDPFITYCDIEGENIWPGEGNINIYPGFCNPETNNFFLLDNSPCITKGLEGGLIGALGQGCDDGKIRTVQVIDQDRTVIDGSCVLFCPCPNTPYDCKCDNAKIIKTGDEVILKSGEYFAKIFPAINSDGNFDPEAGEKLQGWVYSLTIDDLTQEVVFVWERADLIINVLNCCSDLRNDWYICGFPNMNMNSNGGSQYLPVTIITDGTIGVVDQEFGKGYNVAIRAYLNSDLENPLYYEYKIEGLHLESTGNEYSVMWPTLTGNLHVVNDENNVVEDAKMAFCSDEEYIGSGSCVSFFIDDIVVFQEYKVQKLNDDNYSVVLRINGVDSKKELFKVNCDRKIEIINETNSIIVDGKEYRLSFCQ